MKMVKSEFDKINSLLLLMQKKGLSAYNEVLVRSDKTTANVLAIAYIYKAYSDANIIVGDENAFSKRVANELKMIGILEK